MFGLDLDDVHFALVQLIDVIPQIMPVPRPAVTRTFGSRTIGIASDGSMWISGSAGRSWRLARDRFCIYCGVPLVPSKVVRTDQRTRDHVVPISKGGASHFENVEPACYLCNQAKGSQHLLSYLLRVPVGRRPGPGLYLGRAHRKLLRREKRRRRHEVRLRSFDSEQLERARVFHRIRLLNLIRRVIKRV